MISDGKASSTASTVSIALERDEQGELKLGLGCFACILTLLEGLLMVYNFFKINLFQVFDMDTSRSELEHPFSSVQLCCLKVLGIGDLVLACIGAFGIWSCRNVFLALVFESLRGLHSRIAIACLQSLLVWRIAVTILAAPFLGITLAFKAEHMPWHYFLAFLYLAASVAVALALVFALGVVVVESRMVQLEFDLEDSALQKRMGLFDIGAGEPLVFGRLPWSPFIFLWIMFVGASSFVWSVRLWSQPLCIIGGWAVTFQSLTFVPSTHWLEMILYNLSWVTAIVGIGGIMVFQSSIGLEAVVHQNMLDPPEDPLVRRDLIWELERAVEGKWQGAAALYGFLVFSVLRVAFFVPLTGMALFQKNVCGFYVTALSRNYATITRAHATPTFCNGADGRGMALLVIFFVVDCGFLRGVYRVWRHYRMQCALPQDKAISFNVDGPSYGSADVGAPPLPPPASERRPPGEPSLAAEPAAAEEEEPQQTERSEDDDTLCPGLPPLPTDFVVALDSFRKLSAGIYPVPVLNVAGEKLIHMRLPSTPVQGYAVGGRGAWLELCSTEKARQPQASVGPLPRGVMKRRAAEIRGRAGESYGELTPVVSGWEVQRRGRVLLKVSAVKVQTMEISASLPDGRVIATAAAADRENVQLFVDAGNDTLLVLLCMLAVILMSPRPSMLLHKLPAAPASSALPEPAQQPAAEEVIAAPELK